MACWVLSDSSCNHYHTMQDPPGWTIEDTSSNGTFINGRKIDKNKPEPIKAGDVITLAHAESVAAPNAVV